MGGGLERQLAKARRWCVENDHELDEDFELVDPGRSAFKGNHLRDGLLGQLLEMFKAHRIPSGSVLLLEAVDRLSCQEPLDALQDVFLALAKAGAVIVDLEDGQRYSRETLNADPLALVKLALRIQAAHHYSRRLSRRGGEHWSQARLRYRSDYPLARVVHGGAAAAGGNVRTGEAGGSKDWWQSPASKMLGRGRHAGGVAIAAVPMGSGCRCRYPALDRCMRSCSRPDLGSSGCPQEKPSAWRDGGADGQGRWISR